MTSIQVPAPQDVPKRPRLSLKINTRELSSSPFKTASLNPSPRDPTALNTLSNKYALAVDRSPPTQAEPLSAFPSLQSFACSTPVVERRSLKPGNKTPFASSFSETPTSSLGPHRLDMSFLNNNATATPPPLSAGAVENNAIKGSSIFLFPSIKDASPRTSTSPHSLHSKRCLSFREAGGPAPYHHPRSLHSILRNSPLPPLSAAPPSPRRQPSRPKAKVAKRVGYNNPLTQDIVTNQYTKSHIDLLMEEASPLTPRAPLELEIPTLTFNTDNGGRTPGAVESTRRRPAAADASALSPSHSSPTSISSSSSTSSSPPRAIEIGGICKRKKEKKRRWVWTIGVKDEEEDEGDEVGGAIAALRARNAITRTISGSQDLGVQSNMDMSV